MVALIEISNRLIRGALRTDEGGGFLNHSFVVVTAGAVAGFLCLTTYRSTYPLRMNGPS